MTFSLCLGYVFQTVELSGIVGVAKASLFYGGGFNFRISEKVVIGLKYMMLIDSDDYELTTIDIDGKYFF